MAWNRRDDKVNSHPKVLALDGWEPRLLWEVAGPHASQTGAGGVLRRHEVDLVAFHAYLRTPAKVKRAKAKLIEVALWHDHETIADCQRCLDYMERYSIPDLEPGDVVFHDWRECNPPPRRPDVDDDEQAALEKFKEERRRRLKDLTALKEQVRLRDQGLCRYCGVETSANPHDRKSPRSRTLDHVNPEGENTLDNLVVACRRCNGIKRDRTPEQAGMALRPVPPAAAAKPGPDQGRDLGRDQGRDLGRGGFEPGPDQGLSRGRPRDGSGQVGPGSGLGSGPGRPGSGLAGLVRGGAGPGLDGTGLVGFGAGREPPPGGDTDPPPDRTRAAAETAEDLSS